MRNIFLLIIFTVSICSCAKYDSISQNFISSLQCEESDVILNMITDKLEFTITDQDGHSSLYHAFQRSDSKIIQKMIKFGAKLNKLDNLDNRALLYAINNKHLGVLNLLLDAGFSINIKDRKDRDPVILAMDRDDPDIILSLLKNSSDLLDKNLKDHRVLRWAARKGYNDVLQFLIDKGINVNINESTETIMLLPPSALIEAAYHENFEAVKLLVEAGADIKATYEYRLGSEINVLNAIGSRYDILDYFIEKFGFQEIKSLGAYFFSSTMSASRFEKHFKQGININKYKSENNELMYAIKYGNIELVKALIAAGADTDYQKTSDPDPYKSISGDTPLITAVKTGNHELVRILLEAGASQRRNNQGESPMDLAVRFGYYKIFDLFVDDLNLTTAWSFSDSKGVPLLSRAIQNGHNRIAKIMIDSGYNVNAGYGLNQVDRYSWTPLHHAIHLGNADLVYYLISKGAKRASVQNYDFLDLLQAAYFGEKSLKEFIVKYPSCLVYGYSEYQNSYARPQTLYSYARKYEIPELLKLCMIFDDSMAENEKLELLEKYPELLNDYDSIHEQRDKDWPWNIEKEQSYRTRKLGESNYYFDDNPVMFLKTVLENKIPANEIGLNNTRSVYMGYVWEQLKSLEGYETLKPWPKFTLEDYDEKYNITWYYQKRFGKKNFSYMDIWNFIDHEYILDDSHDIMEKFIRLQEDEALFEDNDNEGSRIYNLLSEELYNDIRPRYTQYNAAITWNGIHEKHFELVEDKNKYHSLKMFDGRSDTAWVEGGIGPGIGETVKLTLDRWVVIDSIEIITDFSSDFPLKAFNQVKTLALCFDDQVRIIELENKNGKQIIYFEEPISFKRFELYINDIFETFPEAETAITEISFYAGGKKVNLDLRYFKQDLLEVAQE